ncbi:MAG TPA: DUF805 domain-containing protein [Candidatus Corynebacterium avicola]|uniref:DUF805 domain-containing protein n=1 Tax=Candidatus Corynebacterium avicola TaxID=2838527 RepID=A0A9D1UMF7_9CORY|nr:DUF805 domain-containing protein [Candidatus Corynebacterium avicola]
MSTQEAPLHSPDYSVTYVRALGRFFTRWSRFKGRASQREFWIPALTIAFITFLLNWLQSWMTNHSDIATEWVDVLERAMGIAGLALFIPAFSLAWRRLHDSGMAGGWAFLSFIPVGRIVLFFMLLRRTRPGPIKLEREDPEFLNPAGGPSASGVQTYLILVQVVLLIFTVISFIAGMNNNYLLQVDGSPSQHHAEGAWNYMSWAAVLGGCFLVFFIISLIVRGVTATRGYADQRA